MKAKLNKILINLICSILALIILYHPTILYMDADSYEYFGIVKTIWYQHGSYWDWTTAAGYNHFSLNYLLTLVVGIFAHNSAINFFWFNNFIEVLLLYVGCDLLFKAVYQKSSQLIFPCIVIWLAIYCLSNGLYTYIFASDLFLLLYDAIFLMMLAWQINLLRSNAPAKKYVLFFMVNLYLCATNLRYCSISMLLLMLNPFILSAFDRNILRNYRKFIILGLVIAVEILVGYFMKAALDVYPTDAAYFIQSSSPFDSLHAFVYKFQIFNSSFQQINIWGLLANSLFFISIGILIYSVTTMAVKKDKNCQITYLLITTASIVVLISLMLIINPSSVFNSRDYSGMRYFDLGVIFVIITFILWLVDKEVKNFIFVLLIVSSILTIYITTYFSGYNNIQYNNLVQCISSNRAKYDLQDGLSSYSVSRYLSLGLNMESNDVYAFATPNNNPPISFQYGWLTNIYPKINKKINYAVIYNEEYQRNIEQRLNEFYAPMQIENTINCPNNVQIVKFSDGYADEITKVLLQEASNYRSWFTLNSISSTQTMWRIMPWNMQYQKSNNIYEYFGSMLMKVNNSHVSYINESDLSVQIKYNRLQPNNILALNSTMITYASSSNINVMINYSSSANIYLAIVHGNEIFDLKELPKSKNNFAKFSMNLKYNQYYKIALLNSAESGVLYINSLSMLNDSL